MTTTFALGIGNVLMGDDGFGPHVVKAFNEQYAVPSTVEVIDIGTPGLDLTPWLTDAVHVIIVDTVRAPLAPGTLRLYEKADILRHAPMARTSPHDPGLKETLLTLEFAGRAPDTVTLVGVVPARVAMGTELSDAVAAAVPGAVASVAAALERLHLPARPRYAPSPSADPFYPWWSPAPGLVSTT